MVPMSIKIDRKAKEVHITMPLQEGQTTKAGDKLLLTSTRGTVQVQGDGEEKLYGLNVNVTGAKPAA